MRKIILLIGSIIIVLLAVAAYFILLIPPKPMSQAEKEAAAAQILGRKPILSNTAQQGNSVYKGKYVSFNYPAAAKIYSYRDDGLKKNTSVMETFSFDLTAPRLVFNYAVLSSDNITSINDVPDVRLRQVDSSGYIQSEIQADGNRGKAFERGGMDPEKTGFFFRDNRAYSISITGSSVKEMNKLFSQVIASLRFNF